jgi:hypothetical protein
LRKTLTITKDYYHPKFPITTQPKLKVNNNGLKKLKGLADYLEEMIK